MLQLSFSQFRAAIQEERHEKYRGRASVRIDSLRLPEAHTDVDTDDFVSIFHAEGGARHQDPQNHVQACLPEHQLEDALRHAGVPASRLLDETLPYLELNFPAEVQLECLEGRKRVMAAKKSRHCSDRWIVHILVNDVSKLLRTYLSDGLHFQKQPSDGEFYRKIRGYQGVGGEKNAVFERMWLSHLTVSSNKRGSNNRESSTNRMNRFKQMSSDPEYRKAFDSLLVIPALLDGFQLTAMHSVIGMHCKEFVIRYLKTILMTFIFIVTGQNISVETDSESHLSLSPELRKVDTETIINIEGRMPGANIRDNQHLESLIVTGRIFRNFAEDERKQIWIRLCAVSEKCLLPSLATFFKDFPLLKCASNGIKELIGHSCDSIPQELLVSSFKDSQQSANRCAVQLSDTVYGWVDGSRDERLKLGFRQLWLAAFRQCPRPKVRTQGGQPRDEGKDSHIHSSATFELAKVASKVGFDSVRIRQTLNSQQNRNIHRRISQERYSHYGDSLFLPKVYAAVDEADINDKFLIRLRSAFLLFVGVTLEIDLSKVTYDDTLTASSEVILYEVLQSSNRCLEEDMEMQLESERQKCVNLQKQLDEEVANIGNVQAILDTKHRQNIEGLKKEYEMVIREMTKTHDENLQQQRLEQSKLSTELSAMTEQASKMKTQLETITIETDKRDSKMAKLAYTEASVLERQNQLNEQESSWNSKSRELQEWEDSLNKDKRLFQKKKDKFDRDHDGLGQRMRSAAEIDKNLKKEQADLESRRNQFAEEKRKLQREQADFESKKQQVADQRSKLQQEHADYESQKLQFATEKSKLQQEQADYESQKLQFAAEKSKLQQEQADFINQKRQFVESERQLRQEQADLESQKLQLVESERQLQQGRAELESKRSELRQREVRLQQNVKAVDTGKRQIKSDRESLSRAELRLQQQKTKWRNEQELQELEEAIPSSTDPTVQTNKRRMRPLTQFPDLTN